MTIHHGTQRGSALSNGSAWRGALLWAVVALLSWGSLGCSYASMYGYTVVRSDMEVEYRPGNVGLEVTAADPGSTSFDTEALEQAMRSSLALHATHFPLAEEGADVDHTIRVVRLEVTPREGRTFVGGDVHIVEPDGSVTTELRIEMEVEEQENTAAHAGERFGSRLAHYLENRERYHW